jgi:peptide deformylase
VAKEMFLVMYAAEGVGLAAPPPVGVNMRLMVYNQSGDKTKRLDEVVMVNPQITEFSESKDIDTGQDGSDEFTRQENQEKVYLMVGSYLHEYDHLDGFVYDDHLTKEGRAEAQPPLDELIQEFGEDGAL